MKHIITLITLLSCSLFVHVSLSGQNINEQKSNVNIEEIKYDGGKTMIKLNKHHTQKLKLVLRMEIQTSETEEEKVIYQENFDFNGDTKTLNINNQCYYSALIQIMNEQGEFITQHQFVEGTWTIHNPGDLFFKKLISESRSQTDNNFILERSLVVVPRLYNKVYVSRNVNTQHQKYDVLKFESKELDELKIIFECTDGDYEIFLTEMEDGLQSINLSAITNEFGHSCNTENLKMIHFELKGDNLAMPIRLLNLCLHKKQIVSLDITKDKQKHSVFPNPSQGLINIAMEEAGSYRFELYSSFQQVYQEELEINGSIQLMLPNLPAGNYFYKITNANVEWTGKILNQ